MHERELFDAISLGDVRRVARLLDRGVSPDTRDEDGATALGFAASWGRVDFMRMFLAAGADPDLPDDGCTPLLWAVRGGWVECATLLLEAGCNPDLADSRGRTPLHAAAERGSLELTRLLLEYETDANPVDADGASAGAVARAWIGKDVEVELRRRVLDDAPATTVTETRHTIIVRAEIGEGLVRTAESECGHAEIAALLEARP